MNDWADIARRPGRLTLAGAPEGYDALALADLARMAADAPVSLFHIARDDARMATLVDTLEFFAPDIEVVTLPAWDCLPYDRASPHADIAARRVTALSLLARNGAAKGGRVVITTINAATQRVPTREAMTGAALELKRGGRVELETLLAFLAANGYSRTGTVMEPGEFAIRGGIIDIFPAGLGEPLRLDLFGDEIDTIRRFDPLTQRSSDALDTVTLVPASEVPMTQEAIRRFRARYVELFGTVMGDDALYEAVSEGMKHPGMEHWLPLFHDRMETLFDYMSDAIVSLDPLADDALVERQAAIADYYRARREQMDLKTTAGIAPYKPLPPDALYLTAEDWAEATEARRLRVLRPFHRDVVQ